MNGKRGLNPTEELRPKSRESGSRASASGTSLLSHSTLISRGQHQGDSLTLLGATGPWCVHAHKCSLLGSLLPSLSLSLPPSLSHTHTHTHTYTHTHTHIQS